MSTAIINVSLVLGGLGLFLFGMKIMSTGLETIAGDRLQAILKRLTSNRFFAVTVGIIATIVINSSTATTIMTVSFVNSGMMNLAQAVGVIMGANVGTTFSAQLIAFRLDQVAPLFIFIGMILHLFFKKRKVKDIGYVVIGFGVLFFGVSVMGGPLKGLADHPSFNSILTTFQNPVLAILAGFLFTAIIQSSSATMGILVTMHLVGVPIPFETSAFIILGTNIGTSITTVIASIPANRESKRAALFHIMFDIIGTTVFGTLVFVFPGILAWFQTTWHEPARQVAMFHTLYNFATMFLLLPFVPQVALLMKKIVPSRAGGVDAAYEKKLIYLDEKTNLSPSVAVVNAHLEMCRMGHIAHDNLALALESFSERNLEKANKTFEHEQVVDYLNQNIAAKLVWINNMTLSNTEAEKIGKMFQLLTDMERIGDHAENIAEYTIVADNKEILFSEEAIEEIRVLGERTLNLISTALEVYEKEDGRNVSAVVDFEQEVDKLAKKFTKNHIKRLKKQSCEPRAGIIFTDMMTDLERSGDHAHNIALSVLPGIDSTLD